MRGRVQLLILAFLVLASFRDGNPVPPANRIVLLFNRADSLLNLPNPTSSTDKQALNGFEQLIDQLEKNSFSNKDSLLFLSYMKKGILMDIQTNYTEAVRAYRKALSLHRSNGNESDSLAFMTHVNAGASYYNLNNFDSANYFLLQAESFVNRLVAIDDKVRLYNTLGVLYHDNGNYLQSKNYFTQALEILKMQKPLKSLSVASIETNIATSYYKLGLYDQALSIYKDALKYKVFSDAIYMNMGRAHTALKNYAEALTCFHKVNATEMPWVYNEIAYTQLQLNNKDSAAYFLNRLSNTNTHLNSIDIGINEKYRAELLINNNQYLAALSHLQKAVTIFSGSFHSLDIYANPSDFIGTFAYYRLFDALNKKAETFSLLYQKNNEEKNLVSSFLTYQSALSLLEYIEKSYDTDDAKIFLKKKSRDAFQKALSVALSLYALHPEENYLEQAFLISEKNKASIIAANLKEKSFNTTPGVEDQLVQQERNIKYNIARLDIESDQAKDNKTIESLASEKAKYEIELSRLQKTLEQNNHYYKLKYDNHFPGIKELQQSLSEQQALISFYTTANALHAFAITNNSFAYTRIDSVGDIQQQVANWLRMLKTTERGRKFNGDKTGEFLYTHLIKPLQSIVPKKDEWIIIPDGILYFLPFESLPANEEHQALLEQVAIRYQFSSRFITNHQTIGTRNFSYKVLSFAPFVSSGTAEGDQRSERMNMLPASADEISGINGKKYIDKEATKKNFLQNFDNYSVVHLATHAVSDVNNTSASFIAFFPEKKTPAEDYLFLEELYGLNLDNVKLVIISACETGDGELVNNEGVISLARAFMYAGCPSTVNSLWKADDESTSLILKQFHNYLQKGYSKSKALRQAKLDYVHSNTVYKSPAYWSHLILIGDDDPVCLPYASHTLTVLAALSFCSLFILLVKRKQ